MEEYELVDINGNKTGKILTHNEISKIDFTKYAFIMALTKYINGKKWR